MSSAAETEEALGKRERNKLDKRRRIVAAAAALFQEKGFDDTTTAEIAEKAGIGAGTLYLYVDSKEELLVSVFKVVAGDAWSAAFERVDRSEPIVDQVTKLFLDVTDHHRADERLARSFFKELPWIDQPSQLDADGFVRDFLKRLEELLGEASDRGLLDPDVPQAILASNLYSHWVHHMRHYIGGRLGYDDLAEGLSESVRVALWALAPTTRSR